MRARATTAAILAVVALTLAAITSIVAPEERANSFWFGSAGLALSVLALALAVLRTASTPTIAASFWMRSAPASVALGWMAMSLVQVTSSQHWSSRVSLVAQVLAATTWLVVALGASAVATAADQEQDQSADANDLYERARHAAADLARRCAGTEFADDAAWIARAVEFAPRRAFGTASGREVLAILSRLPATGAVSLLELTPLRRAAETLSRPTPSR